MFNVSIYKYNDNFYIRGSKQPKLFKLSLDRLKYCAKEYEIWKDSTTTFRSSGLWNPKSFLENADIPPFSKSFYSLCFHLGTAPTPEEFFHSYFGWNCIDNGDGTFDFKEPITRGEHGKPLPHKDTLYIDALKHRITRCYPSLFREIHALFRLNDLNIYNDISFEYQWQEDVYHDSDILGFNSDHVSSISLYNLTGSSTQKRDEKESRHYDEWWQKFKILADIRNHSNTTRVGCLDVYDDNVLQKVINFIHLDQPGEIIL